MQMRAGPSLSDQEEANYQKVYAAEQTRLKAANKELKDTIKNLEEKVTLAQAHAKELEKGFSKKMTLAQEEKAALEKKVKKMEKEETQKELETNALITQTLADLKKYQNMDQMKAEED